jgi:nitric oxide reductase subunit C
MTPVAWEPNGRKMVAYGFTEQEALDLIEFFDWIDDVDLNGFDTVVSPLAKDNN